MFREAKQSRIFQDVVDQIQDAILKGRLQPGDMLPPERDLKEMFKTSRGTLREALRVLEQKGLIEIRLGVNGGAIVRDASAKHLAESLELLIQFQKVSLYQLAEFREGVEGTVAAIAAQRASRADIEHLDELLDKAWPLVAQGASGWPAFLDIDAQMHKTLAKITKNPMYIFVHQCVHKNIHRYYEQFLPKDEDRLRENYQDLCDIVGQIKKRNANECRHLARRHVRRFTEHMIRNSPGPDQAFSLTDR